MRRQLKSSVLCILVFLGSVLSSSMVAAAFVNDSNASIMLRNMYMSRDFRNHNGRSTQEDWGQGLTLYFESGFTDGKVGYGLDGIAQLGVKLDSTTGNSGTGVLAVDRDGEPEDSWSEIGLTVKARLSKSIIRLGALQPILPVVVYNDGRLLSGTFTGGMVSSHNEIDKLLIHAGRLTEANLRDSSSRDDVSYFYNGVKSDHFDFAGGSYDVRPGMTASYYYGELDEVYTQHFIGLVNLLQLSETMNLRTDLRYFRNNDVGRALGGEIDHSALMGMLTFTAAAHKLTGAYQRISGDGNFPFMTGSDPYVVNLATLNTFSQAETDSWQIRYDYDFAALGLPGLSFMTRYVKGYNIEALGVSGGSEWERDADLVYSVQNGSLKGLTVRLRNLTFRQTDGLKTDFNENRLIIGYTLLLW